jgi:hypothetical protein
MFVELFETAHMLLACTCMETKTITIRMPVELAETIEHMAEVEHRSANQQIVYLLELGLKQKLVTE